VTGARFSEVDLDLLADYLVGELDEDARERVAGLIGTDPTWAEAYQQLGAADEAVAADLRALAATPERMPADVVARVNDALRDASLGTVISLEDQRRRRQRRYRVLSAAAACVLVAFGGAVVVNLSERSLTSPASTSGGGGSAEKDGGLLATGGDSGAEAPGFSTSWTTVATGRDYSGGDLTTLRNSSNAKSGEQWALTSRPAAPDPAATGSPVLPDSRTSERVPPELRHFLVDPGALADCVRLITQTHPGRPVIVDLARYQGRAAVVVVLASPAGVAIRTPDCRRDLVP